MRLRVFTVPVILLALVLAGVWAGRGYFGHGMRAPLKLPLLLDLSDAKFRDSPPGYIPVPPSQSYNPRRGFGWSHGVKGFDANTWPDDLLDLDALHRDGHLGLNTKGEPGPVFIIDAAPGNYRLKVVSGASAHGVHALGLLVNGHEALPLQELLPDGRPRVFSLLVSSEKGRIEIKPFTQYGTEWLISALELYRVKPSGEPSAVR